MKLFAITIAILAVMLGTRAFATDCPPGVSSCKVLTLTPDEEKSLIAPNGILQTAEQGRFIDLGPLVKYWRDKLATAPAGAIAKPVDANSNPPGAKK